MHTLVVRALAAYRLTRLVTRDTLTKRPREQVQAWAINRRANGGLAFKIDELVDCPFCAGAWVTVLVVIAGRFRFGRWAIGAFGVMGAQALASSVDMTLSSARAAMEPAAKASA